MYELSQRIKELFDNIKKRSIDLNIDTIGSELILSEMIKIEDGIFKFLMNEYDVCESEITEETKRMLVLRKDQGEYSETLNQILALASKVSFGKIKEEHLLYAILETKDSIAYKQIMNL